MSEERRKILSMLAEGKISTDEAERLLRALGAPAEEPAGHDPKRPRWLRIQVEPTGGDGRGERVNVKIPLLLLRTGLKLGSVLPGSVRGKVCTALGDRGIDLDLSKLTPESMDELVSSLSDICIELKSGDENVRICCE